MKNTKWILIPCLLLTACISEQEQREASYRFEQLMRGQCEQTLGFRSGTEGYMNCRMFYDNLFEYAGLTGTMSYYRVQQIQNRVYETTNECRRYLGQSNMDKKALWACIQQKEQDYIDDVIHERELQEQEEILTRSIANGQKEANEDFELSRKIEAERMKVAREKHKKPSEVHCKTHTKMNGRVKIKCK